MVEKLLYLAHQASLMLKFVLGIAVAWPKKRQREMNWLVQLFCEFIRALCRLRERLKFAIAWRAIV